MAGRHDAHRIQAMRPAQEIPGPEGPTARSTRVAIADDQALVRTGFAMILTAAGLEVVDGAGAVDAVRRTAPDVVLMDIRMPEIDGLEATRRIMASGSPPRVIMLATFDLDRYVYAALRAGASGFLLKDGSSPPSNSSAPATLSSPPPSPAVWSSASPSAAARTRASTGTWPR